jgi:hypothetical protein
MEKTWPRVENYLSIHNKHDYGLAVNMLNQLLDEVGDNEKHPLFPLPICILYISLIVQNNSKLLAFNSSRA